MKIIFLALAVLSASVTAAPKDNDGSRLVEGIVSSAIEDLSQAIRDMGLDPLLIDYQQFDYKLPVTDLLLVRATIEDLFMEGLSNIVINNIDYSILASRLRFDIAMPKIAIRMKKVSGKVRFANLNADAKVSGALAIMEIRIRGEVRVSIGISGISIRNINLNFTVGDILSDLNVEVLGRDISKRVNNLLGTVIPRFLTEFASDINAMLEYIVKQILDRLL